MKGLSLYFNTKIMTGHRFNILGKLVWMYGYFLKNMEVYKEPFVLFQTHFSPYKLYHDKSQVMLYSNRVCLSEKQSFL